MVSPQALQLITFCLEPEEGIQYLFGGWASIEVVAQQKQLIFFGKIDLLEQGFKRGITAVNV
jgi:hypothetical protein